MMRGPLTGPIAPPPRAALFGWTARTKLDDRGLAVFYPQKRLHISLRFPPECEIAKAAIYSLDFQVRSTQEELSSKGCLGTLTLQCSLEGWIV